MGDKPELKLSIFERGIAKALIVMLPIISSSFETTPPTNLDAVIELPLGNDSPPIPTSTAEGETSEDPGISSTSEKSDDSNHLGSVLTDSGSTSTNQSNNVENQLVSHEVVPAARKTGWGVLNSFSVPRKSADIKDIDMADMGIPKEATLTEKPIKVLVYERHLAADFDPDNGNVSFGNLTCNQSSQQTATPRRRGFSLLDLFRIPLMLPFRRAILGNSTVSPVPRVVEITETTVNNQDRRPSQLFHKQLEVGTLMETNGSGKPEIGMPMICDSKPVETIADHVTEEIKIVHIDAAVKSPDPTIDDSEAIGEVVCIESPEKLSQQQIDMDFAFGASPDDKHIIHELMDELMFLVTMDSLRNWPKLDEPIQYDQLIGNTIGPMNFSSNIRQYAIEHHLNGPFFESSIDAKKLCGEPESMAIPQQTANLACCSSVPSTLPFHQLEECKWPKGEISRDKGIVSDMMTQSFEFSSFVNDIDEPVLSINKDKTPPQRTMRQENRNISSKTRNPFYSKRNLKSPTGSRKNGSTATSPMDTAAPSFLPLRHLTPEGISCPIGRSRGNKGIVPELMELVDFDVTTDSFKEKTSSSFDEMMKYNQMIVNTAGLKNYSSEIQKSITEPFTRFLNNSPIKCSIVENQLFGASHSMEVSTKAAKLDVDFPLLSYLQHHKVKPEKFSWLKEEFSRDKEVIHELIEELVFAVTMNSLRDTPKENDIERYEELVSSTVGLKNNETWKPAIDSFSLMKQPGNAESSNMSASTAELATNFPFHHLRDPYRSIGEHRAADREIRSEPVTMQICKFSHFFTNSRSSVASASVVEDKPPAILWAPQVKRDNTASSPRTKNPFYAKRNLKPPPGSRFATETTRPATPFSQSSDRVPLRAKTTIENDIAVKTLELKSEAAPVDCPNNAVPMLGKDVVLREGSKDAIEPSVGEPSHKPEMSSANEDEDGMAAKRMSEFYAKRNIKPLSGSRFATKMARPPTPYAQRSDRVPLRATLQSDATGNIYDRMLNDSSTEAPINVGQLQEPLKVIHPVLPEVVGAKTSSAKTSKLDGVIKIDAIPDLSSADDSLSVKLNCKPQIGELIAAKIVELAEHLADKKMDRILKAADSSSNSEPRKLPKFAIETAKSSTSVSPKVKKWEAKLVSPKEDDTKQATTTLDAKFPFLAAQSFVEETDEKHNVLVSDSAGECFDRISEVSDNEPQSGDIPSDQTVKSAKVTADAFSGDSGTKADGKLSPAKDDEIALAAKRMSDFYGKMNMKPPSATLLVTKTDGIDSSTQITSNETEPKKSDVKMDQAVKMSTERTPNHFDDGGSEEDPKNDDDSEKTISSALPGFVAKSDLIQANDGDISQAIRMMHELKLMPSADFESYVSGSANKSIHMAPKSFDVKCTTKTVAESSMECSSSTASESGGTEGKSNLSAANNDEIAQATKRLSEFYTKMNMTPPIELIPAAKNVCSTSSSHSIAMEACSKEDDLAMEQCTGDSNQIPPNSESECSHDHEQLHEKTAMSGVSKTSEPALPEDLAIVNSPQLSPANGDEIAPVAKTMDDFYVETNAEAPIESGIVTEASELRVPETNVKEDAIEGSLTITCHETPDVNQKCSENAAPKFRVLVSPSDSVEPLAETRMSPEEEDEISERNLISSYANWKMRKRGVPLATKVIVKSALSVTLANITSRYSVSKNAELATDGPGAAKIEMKLDITKNSDLSSLENSADGSHRSDVTSDLVGSAIDGKGDETTVKTNTVECDKKVAEKSSDLIPDDSHAGISPAPQLLKQAVSAEAKSIGSASTGALSTGATSAKATSAKGTSAKGTSAKGTSAESLSTGVTSTGATSVGATSTGAASIGAASTEATTAGATSTGATLAEATSAEVTSAEALSTGATSTGATSAEAMSAEAMSAGTTSAGALSTDATSTGASSTGASSTGASDSSISSVKVIASGISEVGQPKANSVLSPAKEGDIAQAIRRLEEFYAKSSLKPPTGVKLVSAETDKPALSVNPDSEKMPPTTVHLDMSQMESIDSVDGKGQPGALAECYSSSEYDSSTAPHFRILAVEKPDAADDSYTDDTARTSEGHHSQKLPVKLSWSCQGNEPSTPPRTSEQEKENVGGFRRTGTPRPKYEPHGYAACFSPTNPMAEFSGCVAESPEQSLSSAVSCANNTTHSLNGVEGPSEVDGLTVNTPPVKPSDLGFLVSGLSSIFGRALGNSNGKWVPAPKPVLPPLPSVPINTGELQTKLQELYQKMREPPALAEAYSTTLPVKPAVKGGQVLMAQVPEYFDHSITPCQSPCLLSPNNKPHYAHDLSHPPKPRIDRKITPWLVPKSPNLFGTRSTKSVKWPVDAKLAEKAKVYDDVVRAGGSGFRILEINDPMNQTKRHPKYTPPADE